MGRIRRAAAGAALLAAAAAATSARASGGGSPAPWYLDQFGGDRADRLRVYDGRLGIVMARSPRPQLYVAWRLLHGARVGREAGEALAIPCCTGQGTGEAEAPAAGGLVGEAAWRAARKLVPAAPDLPAYLALDRDGPNYTTLPNCFPDALQTAADTLKARAAAHGAASPEVRAWLDAQDVVFKSCHDPGLTLPAPPAAAPAWLRADRAYQEAALALYDRRAAEAADRFAAIAKDDGSPWRGSATYLRARALLRAARDAGAPDTYARARAAIDALAAAPPATYGRDEVADMRHVLDFRARPAARLAELDRELARPEPPQDVDVAFRDYATLGDMAASRPDALDWMATLLPEGRPDPSQVTPERDPAANGPAANGSAALQAARTHARARWAETHDVAWLIAAISLADPGAPGAAELVADAEAVSASSPAWLTLRHHVLRLTIGAADPARTRARADEALSRPDLSPGDRNLFTAWRAQAATDMADFIRLALRRRLCLGEREANGCVRDAWAGDSYQGGGVYDGAGPAGTVGFGEDARAVIDRLPLDARMTLGRDARLPARLRLDVALTSFGRAVQLQDDVAADALARDLAGLLPQLAADWRGVVATRPGADKRFAEFLILAKIPGLRTDLVDYTRPEGAVGEFQQYWTDWLIPARSPTPPAARPPALARYQQDGYGVERDAPDAATDLVCLGECGRGAAPLRPPAFAAALQARAASERARLVSTEHAYDKPPPPAPPGAVAAWDEMLSYVQAHPKDPRAPEALYWLVHVGRYGGSHDHSGRRAFRLLHGRYGATSWARKTPYFYD